MFFDRDNLLAYIADFPRAPIRPSSLQLGKVYGFDQIASDRYA